LLNLQKKLLAVPGSLEMTPLRRRMIEDMNLRNFTPKTIQSYLWCIARFARYFNRSPEHLGRARWNSPTRRSRRSASSDGTRISLQFLAIAAALPFPVDADDRKERA
jgi:hypothetical protein